MPYTENQPDVAGAPRGELLPADLGLGPSLMARAQRGHLMQRQLASEATRFAADLATSSLPREQAHNALRQQRLDLHARERATQLATDLRTGFDPAQFGANVEAIRDQPDPAAQLGAIGALRSGYARYRTVPELARLMDEQLASLEPALAARQEARLHERITANRYAFTPEEAAQKFPGYRITPTPLPSGAAEHGGSPSRLIYLAEDDVDPRLEAEAFHLLHTASAWGDPAKLEALDRDPAVAAVLRVPSSKFADAYIAAVSAARSPAALAPAAPTAAPGAISSPGSVPVAGELRRSGDPAAAQVAAPGAPTSELPAGAPPPAAADSTSAQAGSYVRVPAELLGTRDYYLFRDKNASENFKRATGPNYYIDYGLKYFDAFQRLKEQYGKGRPELVRFIDATAMKLQEALEKQLKANPTLENSRQDLRAAAFGTHAAAYRDGGAGALDFGDLLLVAWTAREGLRDYPADSVKQAVESRDWIYKVLQDDLEEYMERMGSDASMAGHIRAP